MSEIQITQSIPAAAGIQGANKVRLTWRYKLIWNTATVCVRAPVCACCWAAEVGSTALSAYRMSSSLANMMTALALEVSSRRLMILSNSPGLGSLGIFKDWAMHTPPGISNKAPRKSKGRISIFFVLSCAFFVLLRFFLFSNDFICDRNNLNFAWFTETLPSCLWWDGGDVVKVYLSLSHRT